MQRKYTMAELDQMRNALWQMVPMSTVIERDDVDLGVLIEIRLQTYILNGTEPAELEEAAEQAEREVVRRIIED